MSTVDRVAAGGVVRRSSSAQGVAVQQGHVAVGDDDGAASSAGQRRRARTRTACPVPCCCSWTTVGALGATSARWAATWSRPCPTTTTRWSGSSARAAPTAWSEQAAAADLVQDLRGRRLHPGALAGGEDDHGGRSVGAHAGSAPGGEAAGGRRAARTPGGYPGAEGAGQLTGGGAGSRARDRTSIADSKGQRPAIGRPGTDRGQVSARPAPVARDGKRSRHAGDGSGPGVSGVPGEEDRRRNGP